MSTDFGLDLRTARRKAGLTQKDAAHLLSVNVTTLSELEGGKLLPTVPQIVTLSLIYGRSFESLYADVVRTARQGLAERLATMPNMARSYAGTFNREKTIASIGNRLTAEAESDGGA